MPGPVGSGPGGCMVLGKSGPGVWSHVSWSREGRPPKTATAAGGTHPTGMHSCLMCRFHNNFMMRYASFGRVVYQKVQIRLLGPFLHLRLKKKNSVGLTQRTRMYNLKFP